MLVGRLGVAWGIYEPGFCHFLRGFCADSSSPQISATLFGNLQGGNYSLCKSPQFSAKLPHKLRRQISKSWLAKSPNIARILTASHNVTTLDAALSYHTAGFQRFMLFVSSRPWSFESLHELMSWFKMNDGFTMVLHIITCIVFGYDIWDPQFKMLGELKSIMITDRISDVALS